MSDEHGRENPPLEAYADEPKACGYRTDLEHRDAAVPRSQVSRTLQGTAFAALRPHLLDGFLVKGVIGRSTVVAIVGASGSGKTFFGGDLAVHIAAGLPWRGHRVTAGLVVYVALEGAASAENRFCAARDVLGFASAIPLVLTAGPVNLRDGGDVDALIGYAKALESEHGVRLSAVFIDTLSRAMAGGEENSSEDMTALIAGADAVRLATGAAIILVHHTGKDESRGARGHSSFKAALDTEIEVSTTGTTHVATVTKQRDLPTGGQYAFSLEVVELGRDTDGDAVTTCVVRAADAPAAAKKAPTGKNQAALLAALQEWQREHSGSTHISTIDLRAISKAQGIKGKYFNETVEPLQRLGWLSPAVGGFTLNSEFEA